MITEQDIRAVTFDKAMRGYRTEDVDAFLQQAADTVAQLTNEKNETEQKLYILAEKIEEYRQDEDNLKTALLNAQRMGENVIKEARQKAEALLREAGMKAEEITHTAVQQVQDEEYELQRIKTEVAQFKKNVLGLYRQHIESLSSLPGDEEEEVYEEKAEVEEPVQELPAEEPAPEAAPELPAEDDVKEWTGSNPAAAYPDLETMYSEPAAPAAQPEAPKAPAADAVSGFQGIKFSD